MSPESMRHVLAARTLLTACADEYLGAIEKGRLAQWTAMAHSIIDLLASEPLPEPQPKGETE